MFPNSKIHRFNDDTSCARPPGTYDPTTKDTVRSKRCKSLENLKTPDLHKFSTPQPPRKIVPLAFLQDKKIDSPGSASTKSEEKLHFSTRLKAIFRSVSKQMKEIHSKMFESVTSQSQEILEELENKLFLKFKDLEELETIISTKESAITSISEKYNNLEAEIIKLQEELENKNEVVLEMNKIFEAVVSQSQENLEELEKKLFLKVKDLKGEFDTKLADNEVDFQTELSYLSHNFDVKKNLIEKEMNDCLSRVSELEDLVDNTTKGLTKDVDEANKRYMLLCRDLCKVESERDDLLVSNLKKDLSIIEIQEKCDEIDEKETKINCLEAEKAGLSLQLDEANHTIANLKKETSQLKDKIKSAGEREEGNNKMIESLQATLQKHTTELLKTSQLKEGMDFLKSEKEELEKKLKAVTDERDKLDKEITDLVGHHNNNQRIHYVQGIKQLSIDLKEDKKKLIHENMRLKAQLQEFKENSHDSIDTPRPLLKAKSASKLASPGVLKERKH